LIWGWQKLSEALRSHSQLQEAYWQSLVGAIETRFSYGVLDQNKKIVAAAMQHLQHVEAKNPEWGGPLWKERFEKLKDTIQKQLDAMPANQGVR
jgi:hypothetical protein